MDYVNGEAVDFDTDQNGQISSVKVGIIYDNFRLKYFQCLYVQGNMRAPASYSDVSRARAKEGGKDPSHGPLRVARLYLAKNEAPEEEAVRALHD